MTLEIKEYQGKNLSCFRTFNRVPRYAEIGSADDAAEAFEYAAKNGLKAFVLGGGSNVFFRRTNIKSFVMKNALPKKIENLGGGRYEVSSSVRMLEMLKTAYADGRDACYYLASAPCEVGGAIAMNAGTGPREGRAIFDFVESVKFVRNGKVEERKACEIEHSHRRTELSENAFILSAIFNFPKAEIAADPIKARLDWARENQDLSVPNCGSLCNKYDARIMKFTRALFSPLPAGMSKKKLNWTYNKADNPVFLGAFLFVLKALHRLFGREIKFEIKSVD